MTEPFSIWKVYQEKAYKRNYRLAHKKEINAYSRDYYKKNKDKMRSWPSKKLQRAFYGNEEWNKLCREYYQETIETRREYNREYQRQYREKHKERLKENKTLRKLGIKSGKRGRPRKD